jgi:hypothetical protein
LDKVCRLLTISYAVFVISNFFAIKRVSLDFRVGVEGFFDPQWQMIGTTDDHSRRKVTL